MINLDNPNAKYLIPIYLLYKPYKNFVIFNFINNKDKYNVNYFNLANFDNHNPKYLIPISLI